MNLVLPHLRQQHTGNLADLVLVRILVCCYTVLIFIVVKPLSGLVVLGFELNAQFDPANNIV